MAIQRVTLNLIAHSTPLALLLSGCIVGSSGSEKVGTPATSTDDLAGLALASVSGTACGPNSLGGAGFDSSCTGNGGEPEYWCADFVKWVWENSGVDVSGLSAAAGSFYVYGQTNGTLSDTPAVGDAVVFNYAGGGYADHVAIVTRILDDGTIETVSGDWDGQDGTEAYFSSTSSAVLNRPAYDPSVGSQPGVMGMTISGFIAPVGVGDGGSPPARDACAGLDDGFYCGGDDVPGDASTLYQCSGQQLAGSQPCASGCQVSAGTQDDACAAAAPPPSGGDCAGLDDGFYCGGDDVPGDQNTLYQCSAGNLSVASVCARNCQVNSGGEDDICGCAGLNDAQYCGGDYVGGDPSTLYACRAGTLSVASACANGCAVEPGALDDECN